MYTAKRLGCRKLTKARRTTKRCILCDPGVGFGRCIVAMSRKFGFKVWALGYTGIRSGSMAQTGPRNSRRAKPLEFKCHASSLSLNICWWNLGTYTGQFHRSSSLQWKLVGAAKGQIQICELCLWFYRGGCWATWLKSNTSYYGLFRLGYFFDKRTIALYFSAAWKWPHGWFDEKRMTLFIFPLHCDDTHKILVLINWCL